jgi:hypothetical protein
MSRMELENGERVIRVMLKIDRFEPPLTPRHVMFFYLFSKVDNHDPK